MALKSQQGDILVGDALVFPKAHAILSGQTVGSIVVDATGDGYSTAPNVVITPTNGGSGATAHSNLTGKKVTSVTVDTPGTSYVGIPLISFTGGTRAAEAFTEIEAVINIAGPDGKAKLIDTTHLKSTGKEYLQGLADFGQISLDCNFIGGVASKQTALRNFYTDQMEAANYKLEIPDGANYHRFAFAAICTSWNLDLKTDDKVGLKITLQVSGGVSYTFGA